MTIGVVAIIFGSQLLIASQVRRGGDTDESRYRSLAEVKKYPTHGVEYLRVARFKLASRKKIYRVNEMIRIDLAMLNIADSPVFFTKLSGGGNLRLQAQDDKGAGVSINPYTTVLHGLALDQYLLLKPGEMVVGAYELLAGCNSEEYAAYWDDRTKLDEDVHKGQFEVYDQGIFERDLFAYWGSACLRLERPGTYTFTAEMTNRHVIVSPREPNVKTAVGSIRSTPLTITITE
jgi:hypothetical protein